MTTTDLTLRVDDREAVEQLREALVRGRYDGPTVDDALALPDQPFSRDPAEIPLYLRLLPPGEPLTALIKLFLLNVRADVDEAARALAPLTLDRGIGIGLLEGGEDGTVASTVDIFPTPEIAVVCDHYEQNRYPTRSDHVLGLSLSSRALGCLTARPQVDRALDIGTGSGVHALFAAPHARHVVATDVNPRAVRFAAFNALLNGYENVEVREGSLYEPVEGETFDLIVSNPPYVISPESEFVYRDSGLPGDTFAEALVRRIPEFLNEGGYAHVLAEWVHGADEPWAAPRRRWVAGSGCDAILFHYRSHHPVGHAATENELLRKNPVEYWKAIDRWLAYYRELGIERIGWGAIVLRKRSGARNWVSEQKVADVERLEPSSDHILRLVAARDFLERASSDETLLAAPLALADEHVLEEAVRLGPGGGPVRRPVLRLEGGLGSRIALDRPTLHVLARLDGRRPLRDVLEEAGRAADGAGGRGFAAAAALPALRRLIELGFVVPPLAA